MDDRVPIVLINLPQKLTLPLQPGFPSAFPKGFGKAAIGTKFGTGRVTEFDLAGDEGGPGATAKGSGTDFMTRLSTETVAMTASEINEAIRDPHQIPIFEMPFTLPRGFPGVSPFSAAAGPAAAGVTASWGIEAAGAKDAPADAGSDIVVAVLDTGIRATHDAFKGCTIEGMNFTGPNASDVTDNIGHGTHTTGTILGRDVDGVRIGIARGVTRVLVGKILENGVTCTTNMIVQSMLWALGRGANVVNMSLGIDFPGYVAALHKEGRTVEEATSIALTGYRENLRAFDSLSNTLTGGLSNFFRGLLVAASGNESRRPGYAITTSPPASGQSVFSVAALDQNRVLWPGSNQDVNIAGPGVDIVSAGHLGDSELATMTGTSMAAPHVSGVAVLYSQAMRNLPGFGPAALRSRIESNALQLKGQSPRDVGCGSVQWMWP